MSIKAASELDLALESSDADDVVGGKKVVRKHVVGHAVVASGAIVVNEPPLPGGPQDPSLEPAQGDDPDC